MNMQRSLIWELLLYEFIWAIMLWKQPKIFVVGKVKVELIKVQQLDGSRNFTEVTRTTMIKQDQVGLKLLILRPETVIDKSDE